MTPELAYFLKINVGIALFYAFYRLFLYKDTFFHWRRTALLCFFGVSLLYPMLNLQEWVKAHEPLVAMADLYATTLLPEIVFDEVTITADINWQDITLTSLKVIYLCGVILFSIRFIVQLISIIRLRIRCKAIQIQGVRIYALNKASGPFSFFHWIFIHTESHTEEELAEVLVHELTHARQIHSADVVFGEWMCIACWFNPFAWLMKREIRNNLEYMADQHVLQTGYDHKTYQYHLLGLAHHKAAATLYNSFNVLPLKNRITMMNKKRTKEIGRTKYLMFLPLAALLMIISNIEAVARTTKDFAKDVIQAVEEKTGQTGETLQPVAAETSEPTTPTTTPLQEKKVEYKGVVVDDTGKGLANATLGAEILNDGTFQKINIPNTKTDANGNFSFTAIEGITTITIDNKDISASMNIKNQDRLNLKIVLLSAAARKKMEENLEVFDIVEKMPVFPGGQTALMEYISQNLRYPAKAHQERIQGRVIAGFVVEKDGSISTPTIVRSVSPEVDAEAIRVLSTMPKWTPGTQRGKEVRVRYTVPILFKLSEPEAEEIKNSKLDEVVVVAYAADENTATDASDTILENAEEMPKYPGGTEGLMRYLAKNIKYPVDAQKSKTQGRVVVQIIVDKEGRVTSPRIAQSVSPSLDAEAIRVVTGMPRWEPGKNKGEAVAVQYTLPINFKLQ